MSDNPLYLAIDQGGHSSRAIVFDRHGQAVTSSSSPVETYHPKTGWVEHDPEELIDSIRTVMNNLAGKLGEQLADLQAAGLATQRSSVVCWDKLSGDALSPVISWQDRRNKKLIDQLGVHRELVKSQTGLRLSPHYGASKIRWCLQHIPEVRQALKDQRLVCGPIASFILFRLLQEQPLCIDPANASRTLLWDFHLHDWSQPLLDLFKIQRDILPECVPNRSDYGQLILGEYSIPLTVTTGDQSAAIYADGKPERNSVFINIGTGAFLQRLAGPDPLETQSLLCSTVWQGDSKTEYVLEGTVNGAGSALAKTVSVQGLDYQAVIRQADKCLEKYSNPPLFLNGVGGLASPWWQANFESGFVGSESISEEEKIVAVLESIVFLINRNLQEMQNGQTSFNHLNLTGGLSGFDGLCQRLADLGQVKILRPKETEATARGLAFLLAESRQWEVLPVMTFIPGVNPSLIQRYEKWLSLMERAVKQGSG